MSFNYGLRPTTHQSLTTSGSSVASAAFGSQTEYVRIATPADIHILFGSAPTASATAGSASIFVPADIHILFGTAPTASATAGSASIFVPADQPEIFKVSPGEKVAVIGTAEVSVTEMSG